MTAPDRQAAYARIRAIVGPKGWIDEADAMDPYLREARGLFRGACDAVVRPASTSEVAQVVKVCAAAGIPMVPQGGNSGLVAGAISPPGSLVISTGRMNRVRAIDPMTYTMTVEAGCILADVQKAAAEADRLFPLSLAAEGTCQIGGNLSTNAGGTAVLRYGNARELVLGIEVVLPDGQIWDGLRGLRKDNTGYDLRHLFMGAEGTLGIITAAVLKLFPLPRESATAFVALRDPEAAIELLARARSDSGDAVTTFELLNLNSLEMVLAHAPGATDPFADRHEWYVLIELTSPRGGAGLTEALEGCLATAIEDGLVLDATIAQSTAQAKALWKLREEVSDVQKFEGGSIKHDISVPISQVAAFIAQATPAVEAAIPGIRPVSFGHVGDGNLHFNLTQPKGMDKQAFLDQWGRISRIVHDIAGALNGSFSAEHGVGQMKVEELEHYKSPVEVALMHRIKAALDPQGLMNPGKVLRA